MDHMTDIKSNVLNTGLMNILAMVVLYLISFFLFKEISFSTENVGGTLLILICGFIPAFLWLSFFYFLDRKEPEPIPMVAAAFMAGIVSEIVFSGFFGRTLFNLTTWIININALPFVYLLYSRGIIPALAIYFVLRYVFYPARHFNESVDGLMYGAFVGIGYALMFIMKDIISAADVSLYYLVFSLLLKLMIFSSLGALVGYFFGQARIREEKRETYFLFSLIVSIIVFTLYAFLDDRFQMNLTTSSDLVSVGLTLVFSVLILAVVFLLIQRSIKAGESREIKALDVSLDFVSVIALVVFIASGLAFRGFIERDTVFVSSDKKISFKVPTSFQYLGEENSILSFRANLKDERYPLLVRVVVHEDALGFGMGKLKPQRETLEVGDYEVTLQEHDRTVHLKDVQGQTYWAHIFEYTAQRRGMKVIVSVESPTPNFPKHSSLVKRILESLRKEA
jgi:RsiW-degrading membrane proteinase PrsW (M82 family)